MSDNGPKTLGAELQQLAHTYSHLFLRAADAFLIWNASGVINNANAATCILTEYDKDEILGMDHRRIFPESMHPFLAETLVRCTNLKDGDILHEAESEIITRSGELIPVTLRLIAVHSPDGASVLGIIHDIRDLKDLEARLALSQARYRGIVEHIKEVILLIDDYGTILFVNAAGKELFSVNGDSPAGRNIRELVAEDELEQLEYTLSQDMEAAGSDHRQPSVRMQGTDGDTHEFELFINSIPDERNQPGGTLVILHDITGRREMEEKLRYAERMRNIELIMSKITHEVKNPLAAINASAEFLRRHWNVDEAEKREVIDLIADETERINRIITEYLRVRRIPAPTLLLYNIQDVVEMVEKSFSRLLAERPNLSLSVDVESAEFLVDADMMKQVLYNLINNAMDAVKDGGTIQVKGRVGEDNRYVLSVKDTGHGMSPEVLAQAFEPFFTSKESGTGIGLAIVRQMVEVHKGDIALESAEGNGTTFSITLPMEGEEQK